MINSANKQIWIMALLVLVGFCLRAYRLDYQSVWADEAFSLNVTRQPLDQITNKLVKDFVHPPLHYYMLHFWFKLVGFGVWQARFLSVIFGTLAIAVIYLLARELFGYQTGTVAALLLMVSQLGIMYSQEARPYALMLFFVLTSSLLFVVALKKRNGFAWWSFVVSAALMTYSHYYGAFVVIAFVGYSFLYRAFYKIPSRWLFLGAAVFLILFLPWMMTGVLEQALNSQKTLRPFQPTWFAVYWFSPLSAINVFNNGRFFGVLSESPLKAYFAGFVLFTLPAMLALKLVVKVSRVNVAESVTKHALLLIALLWLLPFAIVFGLGATMKVQYDVRYIAFCAAPYYILVAHGITQLKFPPLRYLVVAIIVAYSLLSLRANYFIPYKENYRDAFAYLAGHYAAGDTCIFLPGGFPKDTWSVYYGDQPGLSETQVDAVTSNPQKYNRVWLVTYRRVIWAVKIGEEGDRKLRTTHLLKEKKEFFWVNVALYVRKDGTEVRRGTAPVKLETRDGKFEYPWKGRVTAERTLAHK
jgi:4-amino-4-deoxy-L-arabinose transferase-like glycosyltransferase